MAALIRDYIAIVKFLLGSFLLDSGTYLWELKYFCSQETVNYKINLNHRKIRKVQTKICCDPLDESGNFNIEG
jgi:hypothetical protein